MRVTKHEKRLAILVAAENAAREKERQAAVVLGLPPGIAEDCFGPVKHPYWDCADV